MMRDRLTNLTTLASILAMIFAISPAMHRVPDLAFKVTTRKPLTRATGAGPRSGRYRFAVRGCLGLISSCLLASAAFGQGPAPVAHRRPLNLSLSPGTVGTGPGSGAAKSVLQGEPRGNGLAKSMAASARESLMDLGVNAARQALIECQKGDYPGGGMGLLSLPFQRPEAQTDHCRRF